MSAIGAFVACSSESRPPAGTGSGIYTPGGGSGGGGNDGGNVLDGGGDAGGACNNVTAGGQLIDAENVQGDPPAQQGGTIQDGLYDITDVKYYVGTTGVAGPTGETWQGTISYKAKTGLERTFLKKTTATGKVDNFQDAFNVFLPDGGTTIQIAETCPQAFGALNWSYTASPTQLTLVDPVAKLAVTYTHR